MAPQTAITRISMNLCHWFFASLRGSCNVSKMRIFGRILHLPWGSSTKYFWFIDARTFLADSQKIQSTRASFANNSFNSFLPSSDTLINSVRLSLTSAAFCSICSSCSRKSEMVFCDCPSVKPSSTSV